MTKVPVDPKTVLAQLKANLTGTKYHNQPIVVDGFRFASQKEAARYGELRLLEKAGRISQLELQPRYPLIVNGITVATYVADFRYREALGGIAAGAQIVEDVKSKPTMTPVYRLKKKLMLACWGIAVQET